MHTIADWQIIFRLELERLATCFQDDFRTTTSRPSAPIDMLRDQVRGVYPWISVGLSHFAMRMLEFLPVGNSKK